MPNTIDIENTGNPDYKWSATVSVPIDEVTWPELIVDEDVHRLHRASHVTHDIRFGDATLFQEHRIPTLGPKHRVVSMDEYTERIRRFGIHPPEDDAWGRQDVVEIEQEGLVVVLSPAKNAHQGRLTVVTNFPVEVRQSYRTQRDFATIMGKNGFDPTVFNGSLREGTDPYEGRTDIGSGILGSTPLMRQLGRVYDMTPQDVPGKILKDIRATRRNPRLG